MYSPDDEPWAYRDLAEPSATSRERWLIGLCPRDATDVELVTAAIRAVAREHVDHDKPMQPNIRRSRQYEGRGGGASVGVIDGRALATKLARRSCDVSLVDHATNMSDDVSGRREASHSRGRSVGA